MEFRTCELSSYYAVVRALKACRRLETFDNELLLTDLQEALHISEQERFTFLQQIEQDAEVAQLATFPDTDPPVAEAMPAQVAVAHTPRLLPQTPFIPNAVAPVAYHAPSTKSKPKRAPSTSGVASAKQGGSNKRSKSAGNTPSTPRSLQSRGSIPHTSSGAALAKAQADKRSQAQRAVDKAAADLERLNAREREIFEDLLRMGVEDDDEDLNEIQRNLLKWYRLDVRQRDIEAELYG